MASKMMRVIHGNRGFVNANDAEDAGPSPVPAGGEAVGQPNTLDPVEIAMAQVNAGAPPDSPAAVLLSKQSRLIDVHRDLAETDMRYRHLQIAGERMSVVLRVLTVVVGLGLAAGVGAFVASASSASGLVIEPFSVPPDMARNGITGEVVASQLLDRLVRLDAQTDSVRAPSTYDNDWRGNVKVEIPQIGISLGELNRYLRAWLGNEKWVSGELFHSAAGQSSLTVRTGSTPGDTQVGAAAELGTLLDRAAESLYARTQPYRYATNLSQQNRFDEALLVFQTLANGADETERPWGHLGTGSVLWITKGDRAAIASFAKAAELDPGNALALTNLAGKGRRLGRSQAAADHLDQGIRAVEKRSGGVREDVPATYQITLRAEQQLGLGDPIGAVALYQRTGRQVGDLDNPLYGHARALAQSHRPAAALRLLRQVLPHSNERLWVNTVNRLEVVLESASERGDWAGLTQASDAFLAAITGSPRGQVEMQRVVHWRALALARTGRVAEAQQLIATSPRDCYPCLIARGWIAELNKDTRGADRWFADAVAQGPRLPFAHTQWGLALSARGDLDAASAHFKRAAAIAPRYADPLKHWGDVLVRQGDLAAAIDKYDAAAERAPRWGALHLDWGLALQRLGKHVDARKQLNAAAGMDLSAGDRIRVKKKMQD